MAVEKAIASSSLVEVIDRILDKGIVVDAWVRVSLVGIEVLAVEARGATRQRSGRGARVAGIGGDADAGAGGQGPQSPSAACPDQSSPGSATYSRSA